MRALLIIALSLLPAALMGQGVIVPIIPWCPPANEACPPADPRPSVVRTASDVRVELRGRVLHWEIEERFRNRGGMIGEADYVFPLPKGAAFRDLKLSIDGELVAGETMDAGEARRIYEDIVRRMRDPALVEWMGHGMLRTRIFPINPGEERRIVVRFESVAEREGDALRVDYFRGTRYAGAGPRPMPEARRPVATDRDGRVSFRLSYRTGGELGEAYSPTHELDVERSGASRTVSVREGGADITLLLALRRARDASISVLTHAARGESGYALVTLAPPAAAARAQTPRDVTLVLDVSGSMSGRKMDQARASARQLLRSLRPEDRFRLIDFATDVRTFRDELMFATEANLRAAERYVDALEASGATNISGALEEALRTGVIEGGRLPLILFVTDGAPTVGERDPAMIATLARNLRRDARVFTIGIGADVNAGLVEQLALEGRGTAHFIRPSESVERVMEVLAARLRDPVLTDVRITTTGGVRLSRVHPVAPLDVFAGQDLVVLARYEGTGDTDVVVEARAGGRPVRWTARHTFAGESRDNPFVPRLWATQRIGWLSAEKRRGGASSEIDAEIKELGERFGIPTEFTSYLVLEPGMVRPPTPMPGPPRPVPGVGGIGQGSVGAPAAPPAQAAFESARMAAEQRSARSLAAADVAVHGDAIGPSLQRAGTRVFRQEGTRWVDVRTNDSLRVYKVKPYSASYFALLSRIAELREPFAMGDRVHVAGRTVALELVDDARELTEAELNAIQRGW